jgi:hypothetical protein
MPENSGARWKDSVESRWRLEGAMRVFVLWGLLVVCLNVPSATSSQGVKQAASQSANQGSSRGNASEQVDIGKSGTEFMKVCSTAGAEVGNDPQRMQSDAACEGWVEGFVDGFAVHDEWLGVPRADRLVCIPRNVTNVQIIRAINKYIDGNPDKAHRATRLVAALALAQAFPCKRAK